MTKLQRLNPEPRKLSAAIVTRSDSTRVYKCSQTAMFSVQDIEPFFPRRSPHFFFVSITCLMTSIKLN